MTGMTLAEEEEPPHEHSATPGTATGPKMEFEFKEMELTYGLNDVPSWYLTLLLGFQHFVIMSSGCAFGVILLFNSGCVQNLLDQTNLIASSFFVMGITTFVQSTFGTRLPIAQGPSIVFYPVAVGIMNDFGTGCPKLIKNGNGTLGNSTLFGWSGNETEVAEVSWETRISSVAGTIAVGSIVQILIGCTGVMSFLLKFVSPLVVAPTIFLIGFSVLKAVLLYCSVQFYVALTCTILIIIFTYGVDKVTIPIPYYSFRERKAKVTRFAVFSALPILIAVVITYLLCYVLTVTDVLPNNPSSWGYQSRTDIKAKAVSEAGWFRVPHPFQFGRITVNGPGLVAVSCAIMVSIMESIGDYVTAARFCGSASPVGFPMNRGIAAEGFGCLLSGIFGLPVGPTSYSNNIAAISMTKVASRRVIQATSGILVVFGLFPKLSSLFVCIPEPIIGGVLLPTIGVICGVATGSLKAVRMDRPRNAFIFGFSVFFGVVVPMQIDLTQYKGDGSVLATIADIAMDLLQNEMLVGTGTALLLDSLLPGTRRERGLPDIADDEDSAEAAAAEASSKAEQEARQVECYEIAAFHRFYSRRLPLLHRLPLFPGQPRNRKESLQRIAESSYANEIDDEKL